MVRKVRRAGGEGEREKDCVHMCISVFIRLNKHILIG